MNKSLDKVDKKALSSKKIEAIELWRTTRGHISNICRTIGISRQTYYDWLNEDMEFNLAIQEAEGELNDDMREALIAKGADGSSSDIQFYLKNRHPDFKQQQVNTAIQINFNEHAKKELEEFK